MKKLILLLGGLISASALMAENTSFGNPITLPHDFSDYIDSRFTIDGKPMLVMSDYDDENDEKAEFNIYNQDLDNVGSVIINNKTLFSYTTKSPAILEYNPDGPKSDIYIGGEDSLEGALQRINSYMYGYVSEITHDGRTYYYPTPGVELTEEEYGYSNYVGWYEGLGTAYPARCYYVVYTEEYGYPHWEIHEVSLEESYNFTGQWGTPVTTDTYSNVNTLELDVTDFNAGGEGEDMPVTQTLFNDNADFEYITCDFSLGLKYSDVVGYYKFERYGAIFHGITVRSSNGNEIMKISLPENEFGWSEISGDVVIIGDKQYLAFYLGTNGHRSAVVYYEIDKKSNSLRQVGNPIKVSVKPTVIGRDESVNVKFSELNGESHITVTDMKGRVLLNSRVNGDGSYQIPGHKMSNGMNIITVDSPAGKQSTKVMVR